MSATRHYARDMPDRDVFHELLRGYARAGRKLASTWLDAADVAQTVLLALVRALNGAGGVPAPFFAEMCEAVDAARLEQRRTPLLATPPSAAYAHRQAIRTISRRYRGAPLANVVEDAAAQVLIDERGHSLYRDPNVKRTLARALLSELFEHDFASKVGKVIETQGFSRDEARARVDQCRQALLRSPEFVALVRRIAMKPEARHRRAARVGGPKRSTAEIINQPLGDLLSAAPEANV